MQLDLQCLNEDSHGPAINRFILRPISLYLWGHVQCGTNLTLTRNQLFGSLKIVSCSRAVPFHPSARRLRLRSQLF